MHSGETALRADWLGACRAAVGDLREILRASPATRQRAVETGLRGQGGDRTLQIDQAAEDAIFARLDVLHAEGHRFSAISEERGAVDYGSDAVRVVIDPIDGSLNAKRLLPSCALSVAVADGPTMADVRFAFVFDFGTGEEWTAEHGAGARLNGFPLDPELPERRGRSGRLEVLGLEQVDPLLLSERTVAGLRANAERLRALGAMALTICQVAGARLDGMVSLRRVRSVDVAAAQLIVREGGGCAFFTAAPADAPLAVPLGVEARSPLVCARSPETARALAAIAA